jgi:hypothetical protein
MCSGADSVKGSAVINIAAWLGPAPEINVWHIHAIVNYL